MNEARQQRLIAQSQQNITNKVLYENYMQKSLKNIHTCALEGKTNIKYISMKTKRLQK